jgi:hypothetical protein
MKKETITLILLLSLIAFSNAASVQFIDAVGIGNGTLKISSPDNTFLYSLNSTEQFEAQNGTAYILDYQAAGLTQAKQETGINFHGLKALISYFSDLEHLANLLVFSLVLILLLLGVMGKL